jgi:hypothetical protein
MGLRGSMRVEAVEAIQVTLVLVVVVLVEMAEQIQTEEMQPSIAEAVEVERVMVAASITVAALVHLV